MSGLYAVVLAGGRGSRFWPLSREDKPKPFLPFGEDGASQLSATCRRLEGVVDRDRVLVVAGAAHAEHIREQLPELSTGRFLQETQGRGTAAAVALAARAVYREDPEGLLLVCPSDHQISTAEEFSATVRFAVDCHARLPAEDEPATVVLGVEARSPVAGYGYIVGGEVLDESGDLQCRRVSRFVEKPGQDAAVALIESGEALWSTGIFLWSAEGFLRLMEEYLGGLESEEGASGEEVSVDCGILEKTTGLVVITAPFSWLDTGTWDRYGLQLEEVGAGNRARGNFVGLDTRDCIVLADRRIIGTVGVKDLIIVETDDAVLVCHRDSAGRVGELAKEINSVRPNEPS